MTPFSTAELERARKLWKSGASVGKIINVLRPDVDVRDQAQFAEAFHALGEAIRVDVTLPSGKTATARPR